MKKLIFAGFALMTLLMGACNDAAEEINTVPTIEISGESIPDPMDVVFKVLIKDATNASYVMFDTAGHTTEEAMAILNGLEEDADNSFRDESIDAGYIPQENLGITQEFSISNNLTSGIFWPAGYDGSWRNNHLYKLIVRACDENGDEVCVSHEIKALGQPQVFLSKSWTVVIDMDLDNNTAEESSSTECVSIAYKNSQLVCWIITDNVEKEYTPQEIFTLAQNIAPAKYMGCLICDAEDVLVNKTDKPQRLWCAVNNDMYYATASYVIEPYNGVVIGEPIVEDVEM